LIYHITDIGDIDIYQLLVEAINRQFSDREFRQLNQFRLNYNTTSQNVYSRDRPTSQNVYFLEAVVSKQ